MSNICLKERLENIISSNEEYESLLSSKICRFFELEEQGQLSVEPYIPSNSGEFKSKMMETFNNHKDIRVLQIENGEFKSYSDVELVDIERVFRDIVVGTYFCLKNITLSYKYSDENVFKAYLTYLQKTTTACFSYMKLIYLFGVRDKTEQSELINECYTVNISLLSDMYNYLFDSLNLEESIRLELVEKLSTNTESFLYKIRDKEDIAYLMNRLNEDEYNCLKKIRSGIYNNFLNGTLDKNQDIEEMFDRLYIRPKEYCENVAKLLSVTEEELKSKLQKKYFKTFYGGKICEFEKNLLLDYNDFYENTPLYFRHKKANDIMKALRGILFLRESYFMYELALEKINSSIVESKSKSSTLNSIDLESLYEDINKFLSEGFSYLLSLAKNNPFEECSSVDIENVLAEDKYLGLIFRGDIQFNIDKFKEFRKLLYNLPYEEAICLPRDRSCINTEIKPVLTSFNLMDMKLDFKYSKLKNTKSIKSAMEINFPNKIRLEPIDEDMVNEILKKVIYSDISLEEVAKAEVLSDTNLSAEHIENMRSNFIKKSKFFIEFVDFTDFKYQYESDELILKDFRIIHHLRLLYFKYKHACLISESTCHVFEEQEAYLEMMLSNIELIYSKLTYCIISIYNDRNRDNSLDLKKFLEMSCLNEIFGTEEGLSIESLNDFKNFYDKDIKKLNIAQYLEKNPSDEFPQTRKINRHFIIHSGPTNSGKTYQALEDLKTASSGVYLAPLRLLAIEVQEKMLDSGVKCNLITGEEEMLIDNATHISSTVEKANYVDKYNIAVIDECQMIGDVDRGGSWTKAVLGIKADIVHLCTAPSAVDLLITLIELCEDSYEVITHTRNTKLLIDRKPFKGFEDCEKGDALIVFSKKNVLAVASALLGRGIKSSIIYGALPYKTRKLQMEKFLNGETDIIVATDAIGLGLNAPIKRVVFIDTYKFDGYKKRKLYPEEIRQIAGRAGRFGMYDVGYVNAIENLNEIEAKLNSNYWHIEKAKLTLPESIVNVEGDLAENIKLWSEMDSLKNFEKSSIERSLFILKELKKLGYSDIGNYYSYKLSVMYFEDGDKSTFELWVKYLNDYFRELKDEMEKPKLENYSDDLQGLESYNKSLELYYAFSKSFSLPMDLNWVNEERLRVSEKINNVLLTEIKKYRKTCKSCGAELKWDSLETECVKCALMNAMQSSGNGIRFNIKKK